MHINTDNYYDKMADDYYNSEAFGNHEQEQTFQCQKCKEEFTGEEYDDENGECPECEVKLIEIYD